MWSTWCWNLQKVYCQNNLAEQCEDVDTAQFPVCFTRSPLPVLKNISGMRQHVQQKQMGIARLGPRYPKKDGLIDSWAQLGNNAKRHWQHSILKAKHAYLSCLYARSPYLDLHGRHVKYCDTKLKKHDLEDATSQCNNKNTMFSAVALKYCFPKWLETSFNSKREFSPLSGTWLIEVRVGCEINLPYSDQNHDEPIEHS